VNSSFAYTYDALGRVTSMTTGGVTTDYGYDADGELTSVAAPGESIQYAYDPSGNRTSVTDNGVVTPDTANSVNEYTAVGGTTYGYDADGNLISSTTSGATTTYTFNSLNQLTGVNSPTGSFAYTYDPLGNQISSTVNGTVTNNLIDPLSPGTILAQVTPGQSPIEYAYGLGLVSQTVAGVPAYYDFDRIGSTVGITNSSGTYVNQYSYQPFGQTTTERAGLTNPFTFVGQYGVTGDGNGLFEMTNRDYDPTTGQFVSDDPLGLRGGDINFRRYVGNDPIDLIDPSGLEGEIPGGPTPTPRPPSIPPGGLYEGDEPFDWLPPTPPPPLVFLIPNPFDAGYTLIIISADPNDITGPNGFGAGGFITPGLTLPYTIDFENLATANGPAQTVVVAQQLSPNLDWSTFQLGAIGFGSTVINVPAGRDSYSTQIDAQATLGLLVDVTAGINLSTGLVTWTFTSIDPTTLDLTSNPLAGFLPPDVTPPEGEGFVSYTIKPKANLGSDGVVSAQATVVFDTNPPINTPTLVNTLDVTPPTSSVNPLPPTTTGTSFTVSWSGSDPGGPGIANYNVFVSEDGGPFQPLLLDTTQTSTTFTGQLGHTYGFMSVATDSLGLVQMTPSAAQTSISLVLPPPVVIVPPPPVVISQIQLVENRHHLVTQIVVTFSGAVNAAEAATTAPFHLATPGKRGSFTAKNAGTIKLKSAAYNPATGKVTLTPRKAFALSKPVQLRVYAELPFGLEDSLGHFINDGTDALSILTKREVTKGTAAVPAAR
jgi:RHS repeat-associated protein